MKACLPSNQCTVPENTKLLQEYKEAITTEQCEEIQKFYEPYVMKYETKYKVLYQILRQASR